MPWHYLVEILRLAWIILGVATEEKKEGESLPFQCRNQVQQTCSIKICFLPTRPLHSLKVPHSLGIYSAGQKNVLGISPT